MAYTKDQKRIAQLLGINKLNSQNDVRQINEAKDAAQQLGIRNLDSQNDVRQIREYLASNNSGGSNDTPPTTAGNTEIEEVPPAYQTAIDNMQVTIDNLTTSLSDRANDFSNLESSFETKLGTLATQLTERETNFRNKLQEQQDNFDKMQTTLLGQMNPAFRNPVMGVRFAGKNNLNRQGLNKTFGRSGSRIQGIKNTSLNVT